MINLDLVKAGERKFRGAGEWGDKETSFIWHNTDLWLLAVPGKTRTTGFSIRIVRQR